MPWGTHFCLFYETNDDFLEAAVSYLGAGLESDEFCMWLIAEPLMESDAWAALDRFVPGVERHRAAGAIEILPSRDWYLTGSALHPEKIIRAWNDKLAGALQRGHAGMRVLADTQWLPAESWRGFAAYEQALNGSLADRRLVLACGYPLAATGAAQVFDVVRTHQFATAKRAGRWEVLETASLANAKAESARLNAQLEGRVVERPQQLQAANERLIKEAAGRQRTEDALQRNEQRFHALFEQAAIGIALFDPVDGLCETNGQLQWMLGYSKAELCGMSTNELIDRLGHPEEAPLSRLSLAELFAGQREQYTLELRYFRRDATLAWANVTVSLVRDEVGRTLFGTLFVQDITERKQAEDALRKVQAELAHVTRVMTMGEMVASIGHEVNQPLAAVVTNANASLRWLAHEPPNLDESRAAVQRIIAEGTRASEVIQRIRALVKKTDPERIMVDVNDVIRAVVMLTQNELTRDQVVLHAELSSDLPPVLADRVELQQVVLNLMMNGIEAMGGAGLAGGRRELWIRSAEVEPGMVLVEVRDSGIGLDPQSSARLFEAFFTTKPAGLGMGLSISRSIISAHGGRLWAVDNPAGGATFQFTLPSASTVLPSPRSD